MNESILPPPKNALLIEQLKYMNDLHCYQPHYFAAAPIKVKVKGECWIIHKNDRDPFPSNPHAHNYDSFAAYGLDLGTGRLYQSVVFT